MGGENLINLPLVLIARIVILLLSSGESKELISISSDYGSKYKGIK